MTRRRSRGVMAAVTVALLTSLLIATAAGAAGRFTDDNGNTHEGMIEAIAAEGITRGATPRERSIARPTR